MTKFDKKKTSCLDRQCALKIEHVYNYPRTCYAIAEKKNSVSFAMTCGEAGVAQWWERAPQAHQCGPGLIPRPRACFSKARSRKVFPKATTKISNFQFMELLFSYIFNMDKISLRAKFHAYTLLCLIQINYNIWLCRAPGVICGLLSLLLVRSFLREESDGHRFVSRETSTLSWSLQANKINAGQIRQTGEMNSGSQKFWGVLKTF